MLDRVKAYYRLTKPGIIYGNLLAAGAGFLLASKGHIDFWLGVALLVGTSLGIGSGCVFNNYIDRGIDKKMKRTQKRALVSGVISGRNALIYATVLGVVGFYILAAYTNWLVVLVGAIGFIDYVILYGLAKRAAPVGTIVGSISGATPPVAGYVAVTGHFDTGALLLFVIMVIWQMPHFYSIAIFRMKDYQAAGLPVLPAKKGVRTAKFSITGYIIAYIIASLGLTLAGYTGITYGLVMLVLGGLWLDKALAGFSAKDDVAWARKLFGFSLIVLLAFCVMISANMVLP